jgi:hypothetical protein
MHIKSNFKIEVHVPKIKFKKLNKNIFGLISFIIAHLKFCYSTYSFKI